MQPLATGLSRDGHTIAAMPTQGEPIMGTGLDAPSGNGTAMH